MVTPAPQATAQSAAGLLASNHNRISDRGARSAESASGLGRTQTLEPDLGNASAGSSVILQPRHVRTTGMACVLPGSRGLGGSTVTSTPAKYAKPVPVKQWRTVDIVVAAIIAVAFGVIF